MSDILNQIIAVKREEVAAAQEGLSWLRAQLVVPPIVELADLPF